MSATRIGKRHSFVLAQNESGKISCIIFFKEVGARKGDQGDTNDILISTNSFYFLEIKQ
jgi:hypothetical protein